MTITDVAGLEALPVGQPLLINDGSVAQITAAYQDGVVLSYAGGARMPLNLCGRFLPAEVLAPRTVTAEQVEAGVEAMVSSQDDPEFPRTIIERHADANHQRFLLTAALTAMGFEVRS